jgi:hypothetical protein
MGPLRVAHPSDISCYASFQNTPLKRSCDQEKWTLLQSSITPDDETVRPELVEGHLGWRGASTSSARTVFHVNPVTELPTSASL